MPLICGDLRLPGHLRLVELLWFTHALPLVGLCGVVYIIWAEDFRISVDGAEIADVHSPRGMTSGPIQMDFIRLAEGGG